MKVLKYRIADNNSIVSVNISMMPRLVFFFFSLILKADPIFFSFFRASLYEDSRDFGTCPSAIENGIGKTGFVDLKMHFLVGFLFRNVATTRIILFNGGGTSWLNLQPCRKASGRAWRIHRSSIGTPPSFSPGLPRRTSPPIWMGHRWMAGIPDRTLLLYHPRADGKITIIQKILNFN